MCYECEVTRQWLIRFVYCSLTIYTLPNGYFVITVSLFSVVTLIVLVLVLAPLVLVLVVALLVYKYIE